jgi:hypothetical protein
MGLEKQYKFLVIPSRGLCAVGAPHVERREHWKRQSYSGTIEADKKSSV